MANFSRVTHKVGESTYLRNVGNMFGGENRELGIVTEKWSLCRAAELEEEKIVACEDEERTEADVSAGNESNVFVGDGCKSDNLASSGICAMEKSKSALNWLVWEFFCVQCISRKESEDIATLATIVVLQMWWKTYTLINSHQHNIYMFKFPGQIWAQVDTMLKYCHVKNA